MTELLLGTFVGALIGFLGKWLEDKRNEKSQVLNFLIGIKYESDMLYQSFKNDSLPYIEKAEKNEELIDIAMTQPIHNLFSYYDNNTSYLPFIRNNELLKTIFKFYHSSKCLVDIMVSYHGKETPFNSKQIIVYKNKVLEEFDVLSNFLTKEILKLEKSRWISLFKLKRRK
ncbi:MAG: hypothetical protein ACTSXL_01615 [Alphaproteobacteria bacterium]|nr:MAG: hypothetical protein B6I23_01740 [Rickettsiaceae bacterium 4572_127]